MLKFSSLIAVTTFQILNTLMCLVAVKWVSAHTEHFIIESSIDEPYTRPQMKNKTKKEAKANLLKGHQYNSFQGEIPH